MAVSNFILRSCWPILTLLWICVSGNSFDFLDQEEDEIFHSDKQSTLSWTSEPDREWGEVKMGNKRPGPVLQACGRRVQRTVLSRWMERKDAHFLLMDVSFTQEEETSGQLSPLQVHLFDSDTPFPRFKYGRSVLDLQTSRPFPVTIKPQAVLTHLNLSRALDLGPVSHRGFQIGFSYSGTCVLLTSIRLYYRKCSDITAHLVKFKGTGAGSGPAMGSCVKGAVEVSPPVRECSVGGVWGPLQGGCTCEHGHHVISHTCEACEQGFYKPANDSGRCRLCPPNSRTHTEGSGMCVCVEGFSRLTSDSTDIGCTKPPSAPLNPSILRHNGSVLLSWDPPHDLGGRQEVMYDLTCEEVVEDGGQWRTCGPEVAFLPDSAGLNSTMVKLSGLDPKSDYRLSVRAWNEVSGLQGAPPSSTTSITIHRWKVPHADVTVTTSFVTLLISPSPQKKAYFSSWLVVGVLFFILLLTAMIPIAVCVLRHRRTKFRSDQEVLFSMSSGISYRRPEVVEAAPPATDTVGGGVELLVFGDRLKDFLVDRNKLTLGKELGRGEFGSVYEGVFSPSEGVNMKVAVKTMRVGLHSQADLHDFLKEAELMQNFRHENVVRLLGVTVQREQDCPLPVPLVILPYMKHGDLRRFLIATRYGDVPMFVPVQSLLRFMVDIAAGMEYLSSQGFLHRDLAARNCMLGDDLHVCVADFGLSKRIYSSNYYRQRAAVRVPIKWMSMESLSESVYSIKSDVWSFGVTMWEILSRGRTPYPGVNNHELLDLLRSGFRMKPPEECDNRLYEVMRSCWDEDPILRPAFGALVQTLKGFLSELPELDVSEEANYINQGLQAAAAAPPHTDGRGKNIYLCAPVGAAAREEEVELEDGYLKYIRENDNK
ncbi:tyrosine-protein kinase receptor TYRO3-like isoform X1 [Notolabrus celidotus]|uniref:tyrosine-protein kinase receptor TYRO3-like isoform X1 n=1 Tax=Notolabrus celidotus TaxID=1203425 RepID=UPI00148FA017|nr:tyrosine-protein kinase receptor TYRO3-like isoform X1 [Notolabrus celidotus]